MIDHSSPPCNVWTAFDKM